MGNIQWFRGPASPFAGVTYALNDKVSIAAEYSPDLMNREASYLEVKSPYNLGASYRWSEMYFSGCAVSSRLNRVTGCQHPPQPQAPPKWKWPRARPGSNAARAIEGGPWAETNIAAIKNVLEADDFLVTGMVLES